MNSFVYALPVEIKTRDFLPRLYLGVTLAKRGMSVLIGGKNELHRTILEEDRQVVYFNKGRLEHSPLFDKIRARGGYIVYLDEEGGVYFKDLRFYEMRVSPEVLLQTDLYLAWGAEQVQYLRRNRWHSISGRQIGVTGHPRFDLCRPEWDAAYEAMGGAACETEFQSVILFNLKFSLYNNHLGHEHFLEYFRGVLGRHFDADFVRATTDYQRDCFEPFMSAIRVVAETYPESLVIVRPHPIEGLERYEGLFDDLPNVRVTTEGSSRQLISHASITIHHDCTTGIEAMINEKCVVSYCPILDDRYCQWLPVMAGYRVSREEDLVKLVGGVLRGDITAAKMSEQYDFELIKRFISNLDGESAALIAETLEQLPARCALIPRTNALFCRVKRSLRTAFFKNDRPAESNSSGTGPGERALPPEVLENLRQKKNANITREEIDQALSALAIGPADVSGIEYKSVGESVWELSLTTD